MSALEAIEVIEGDVYPVDSEKYIEAFDYLYKHGYIGHLQGFYQREAYRLLQLGLIGGDDNE